MRPWVCVAALLCVLALCAQTGSGWSGDWAGEWSGQSSSGAMHLKLAQVNGAWKAEASFTLEGADVPTVIKSVKIEGDSIDFDYSFDVQGYKLISKLSGKRKDKTVEGTYNTTAEDGSAVDSGKWKLALK